MRIRLGARTLVAAGAVTLAVGNLGRIPGGILGGRSAPLVLNDVLLVPLWLMLLTVVARRLRRWPLDGLAPWILTFGGVALLSLMQASRLWGMGGGDLAGAGAFLARWWLYAGWYWLAAVCLSREEVLAGTRWFERALLAIAAFGVVQAALLPGFAQRVGAGGLDKTWDEQGHRLVSTMLDPNFAGILIVIALLLSLARERERVPQQHWLMLLLGAAVLLTLSRSALLALAVGLLVLAWTRGLNRRLVGILVGAALVILPFLTLLLRFADGFNKLRLDASAAQRLIPWSRALIMWSDHPWLGVGFNAVQQAQKAYGWAPIGGADVSLDGGLLFIAAMTGVIGLGLYVALLGAVLKRCRVVYRGSSAAPERALAAGTAAATAAVVVHSLFVNSLLLPFVMQLLWFLWGSVVVLARPCARAARSPRGVRILRASGPAALAFVIGCDPCSGVASCRTAPVIALGGQMVNGQTGAPERGVVITIAGARAESDAEGLWQLVAPSTDNVTTVDVTVQAPSAGAYTIRALPVRIITAKGDLQQVGRWTSVPYARYQASLARLGQPFGAAAVSYVVTGGVAAEVVAQGGSNSVGVFELQLRGRGDLGTVLGTLTVSRDDVARVSRFPGFAVPLDYRYEFPRSSGVVNVDGQRSYGGEVLNRGTGQKEAGGQVEFTRTSGVAISPSTARTVADSRGYFLLSLDASVEGAVVGDLTVRSADGSRATTYRGISFASYDSTNVRNSGLWAFGERWAWSMSFWRRDLLQPVADMPVEFERTGGPTTVPNRIAARTDRDGRFSLTAAVNDTGTVVGNFTLTPPDGPVRVLRNVRYRTFASDSVRDGGVVGFGPSLRYVLEVKTNDRLAPAANVAMEFRRTGGVAITPERISGRSGPDGRFELRPAVTDSGTVLGDLVVSPALGAPRTIPNIRLSTFETGDLRFGGVFGYGPSLHYAIELWTFAELKPAPNVSVEFRRTGGVAMSPERISSRTGADGRFEIAPSVADSGTVVGEIAVFPAVGPPRIISNVRLQTFETGDLRFGGVFGFGPALRYVGEVVRQDGTPVVGAQVTWTQSSGIPAAPSTFTVVTDQSGRFPITLNPSLDGEVVGTVRVVPPLPWAAGTQFTFGNLRLNSFESGELRLAVTYRIPPP